MLNTNLDHAKREFDRNGFVVLRNHLSSEETAEVRQHLGLSRTHGTTS